MTLLSYDKRVLRLKIQDLLDELPLYPPLTEEEVKLCDKKEPSQEDLKKIEAEHTRTT